LALGTTTILGGNDVATIEQFLYWYGKAERKECTKDHARQMLCMKYDKWKRLLRDYKDGEDISKYFKEASL
jgi:hypothetical protein